MKKNKKKKPYAQRLIPWIVLAIMVYTIADIYLQAAYQVEISPTLTGAYFLFWSTELVGLATIKNHKIKNNYTEQSSDEANCL